MIYIVTRHGEAKATFKDLWQAELFAKAVSADPSSYSPCGQATTFAVRFQGSHNLVSAWRAGREVRPWDEMVMGA